MSAKQSIIIYDLQRTQAGIYFRKSNHPRSGVLPFTDDGNFIGAGFRDASKATFYTAFAWIIFFISRIAHRARYLILVLRSCH
ncbi:hypothetical protein BRO17_02885 [Xanthomonas oryzae pv. oryzae]|nr:hypothetical protein LA09_03130 [Xanthomonas oryzae pv. oryzae]RBA82786.1 hypothetical protein BRO09_02815 [Xanthomonas oryzae pv. oryzae]RBB50702.1 hypothetical protein BRN62_13480 [Xanthomonas oryzae pv. oryzae]RBB90710.1 hypothetical protein BRN84_03345 [Xanthomonas oryzae pv. oryzae]RBC12490.1 hypothetical protein BRN87_14035 [Xanthomonas oryzae pv. oryzae]